MPPRSPSRALRIPAALLLAAGVGLTGVAPAAAVPPFRLAGQVTDQVGALGGGATQVEAALRRLREDDQVQLWVVYVDSFDGEPAQTWADDTASASGLGEDDVLLGVATGDRAYAYSVDERFRLDDEEVDQVARDTEDALAGSDWAGAAVAGADAIDGQLSGSRSGWGLGAVVLVVVVLGLVGLAVALGLRRRRRHAAGTAGPTPEFAATSTADLTTLADTLLVRADDAVRASAEELQFATAEFGAERTAEFAAVLAAARSDLTAAFTARQSLEDEQPETEQQRREVLARVVEACRSAGTTLDAASDRLDALRDLVSRAPQVLQALAAKLPALRAGVDPARAQVAGWRDEFGAAALASVADTPEQAADRIALGERALATARQALGDASRSGEVVDAVRSAESSLAQAEQLLASVPRTGTDLRRAVTELPVASARLRAAAGSPVTAGGPGVSTAPFDAAAAAALAVADSAATQGATDPLGALHRVVEAERALDAARAGVESALRDRRGAQDALEQALVAARAEIAAAEDFVSARRGAVGGAARTRLGEAQRHLEQATALAGQDPAAALEHARQADALAERAGAAARADVESFGRGGQGPGYGGTGPDLGSLLGGILIGSGNRRSGWGGSTGGWGGGFGGGVGGGVSSPRRGSGGSLGGSGRRSGGGGGGRRGSSGRF